MHPLPICLLLLLAASPARAGDIVFRMHGSNTVGADLAPALVVEFARQQGFGEVRVEATSELELRLSAAHPDGGRMEVELHAHGSGTAFSALLDGKADIGMSSRRIQSGERERAIEAGLGDLATPAMEHVIGLDGIAIIVHPDNPVRTLGVAQVRKVFSGQVTNWSAFGGRDAEIVVHARDEKSGTFDTFRSLVLGTDADIPRSVRRYESNTAIAAAVNADVDAIGFVALNAIGKARALAISVPGVQALRPDRFSVATEDYVLARRLFLYAPGNPAKDVNEFLEFVHGPAGQAVVERSGFVAQSIAAIDAPARPGMPEEYLKLTANAQRLSMNLRFGTGDSLLDSKAERDLNRLAAFLRAPENSGRRLMLLGFADDSEVMPYVALWLSNERVDHVARALAALDVRVHHARGLGAVAPVASNADEAGRLKNRRVEIWLDAADAPAPEVSRIWPSTSRPEPAESAGTPR